MNSDEFITVYSNYRNINQRNCHESLLNVIIAFILFIIILLIIIKFL